MSGSNGGSQRRKTARRTPSRARVIEKRTWEVLLDFDTRRVAAARQRLDGVLMLGLRHFSAIGRAVPLSLAQETANAIRDMDRAAASDDVS